MLTSQVRYNISPFSVRILTEKKHPQIRHEALTKSMIMDIWVVDYQPFRRVSYDEISISKKKKLRS